MRQHWLCINRNTQRNSCQHTPHTPRANSSKQSHHNHPIVVSTHPDQHIISPISHPPVKYFRGLKREGGRGCLWALHPPSRHPTFSVLWLFGPFGCCCGCFLWLGPRLLVCFVAVGCLGGVFLWCVWYWFSLLVDIRLSAGIFWAGWWLCMVWVLSLLVGLVLGACCNLVGVS